MFGLKSPTYQGLQSNSWPHAETNTLSPAPCETNSSKISCVVLFVSQSTFDGCSPGSRDVSLHIRSTSTPITSNHHPHLFKPQPPLKKSSFHSFPINFQNASPCSNCPLGTHYRLTNPNKPRPSLWNHHGTNHSPVCFRAERLHSVRSRAILQRWKTLVIN